MVRDRRPPPSHPTAPSSRALPTAPTREPPARVPGYRDDDDGILAGLEAAAEGERLGELTAAWEAEQAKRRLVDPAGVEAEQRDLATLRGGEGGGDESFVAHVVVPDQAAIKKAVLARRKQELLAKLASSESGGAPLEEAPRVETLDAIKRLPPSW